MNPDNKDLKTLFAAADRNLPLDEKRKTDTLKLLCREMESQIPRAIPDQRRALLHLARYANKNLPGIHLLCCIALLVLLAAVSTYEVSAETMLCLSMLLPCCLAFLSAFEVKQICFTKMAELSETCFFHVRQLAALTMLLSGVLNLTALSVGILFISLQYRLEWLRIGIYTLVPFIFIQCASFGCMLTEAGRKHVWINVALCVSLSLLCVILFSDPMLYTRSALSFWTLVLLTGTAILVAETGIFFSKLGKGELLCTS